LEGNFHNTGALIFSESLNLMVLFVLAAGAESGEQSIRVTSIVVSCCCCCWLFRWRHDWWRDPQVPVTSQHQHRQAILTALAGYPSLLSSELTCRNWFSAVIT